MSREPDRGRENADRKIGPTALPAPRVTVELEGQIEPVLVDPTSVGEFRAAFLAAFGTSEHVIAEALFEQILSVLHTELAKPLAAATANLALALLHRIHPRDELEAMLACQIIAAHVAAIDATRRALHVEQSAAGRAAYLSLARKLMNTFTLQLDALGRHRGRPTVQKVVVERVIVAPGGQAVVGAVAGEGRGHG